MHTNCAFPLSSYQALPRIHTWNRVLNRGIVINLIKYENHLNGLLNSSIVLSSRIEFELKSKKWNKNKKQNNENMDFFLLFPWNETWQTAWGPKTKRYKYYFVFFLLPTVEFFRFLILLYKTYEAILNTHKTRSDQQVSQPATSLWSSLSLHWLHDVLWSLAGWLAGLVVSITL